MVPRAAGSLLKKYQLSPPAVDSRRSTVCLNYFLLFFFFFLTKGRLSVLTDGLARLRNGLALALGAAAGHPGGGQRPAPARGDAAAHANRARLRRWAGRCFHRASDASTEGKIGLLAPGSAGISRTHATLEVPAESLTIAGRSINLINVVRASGAAPLAVKRGKRPLALEHDDLVQLDGFRDDPRFVFRVEKITNAATDNTSPPDDAPTEPPSLQDELRVELLTELTDARDSVARLEREKAALAEEKQTLSGKQVSAVDLLTKVK
jgi:hypothetical protein